MHADACPILVNKANEKQIIGQQRSHAEAKTRGSDIEILRDTEVA